MPRAGPQGSELLASLPISKRFKPRKSGGGGGEARRRRRRRDEKEEEEEEEEEEERRGGGEGGGGAEHEGRWEPGNQKQTLHQGVVKNNKMLRKGKQVRMDSRRFLDTFGLAFLAFVYTCLGTSVLAFVYTF